MLDRLKEGVQRRAKRLSRHSILNQHSEYHQQESSASDDAQAKEGEEIFSDHPGVHPLTAGPAAPRPAVAESPGRSLHSTRQREHASHDSTEDFSEHPAIHPLTTEPSPRTPHLEKPHPSFSTSSETTSLQPKAARRSSSSDSNLATSHPQRSRHAIGDYRDPERTVSKSFQSSSPGERPCDARETVQQPDTEYTQLNGKRRWSNGSLVLDSNVSHDEQVPRDSSPGKDAAVRDIATTSSGRQVGADLTAPGQSKIDNDETTGCRDSAPQYCDICHDEQLHHKLSTGGGFCEHKSTAVEKMDHSREELAALKMSDLALTSDVSKYDSVQKYDNVDFDHTVHTRPAVTHKEIKPQVHTVYEPRRTRSIHYHEHKKVIQPITDPNPEILPEQHWAQDHETGEVFRIPSELGKQLSGV